MPSAQCEAAPLVSTLGLKKLYIKTYGCQMNVYDSDRMADLMAQQGYVLTEVVEEADMVILNTCHIREKATEKMYSELGRLQPLKEKRSTVIAIAGCVAQAEGDEIFRRAPYVDVVVGPQSYHHLPDLVARVQREKSREINLDFPAISKFDELPEASTPQGPSAFVSVQEGCDKFCHFCVVSYTRGAEYSRPVSAVYRETLAMVANGAKEITLLGQNVNAYHGADPEGKGEWSLGRLILHLATIPQLARLRYTTSHPLDMHEALYHAHAIESKLMPFVHLPVQAGSDRILHAMNRKHTAATYLRIIEKLKQARPDIAFSSDFIVGFPGETEADFEETLALVREVGYASAYSFKYSPRPGTPGALRADQISEEIKSDRLTRLQTLLQEQQWNFNQLMVGKVVEVLFEKPGKYPGQLVGRSPYMQAVHVMDAPASLCGTIVPVQIIAAHQHSVEGKLTTTCSHIP